MSLQLLRTDLHKKIIVAMSGGVDSSVAAALLKRAGFSITGVFMRFWSEGKKAENRCCSPDAQRRARMVAAKLKIPFYVFNFEKEFKKRIVDYFLREYKAGRTPNPCVVCNKEIKFGLLLEKALALGADYVATGHYARVSSSEKHNNFPLRGKFCSTLGLALPPSGGNHGRSPSEKFSSEDTLAFRLFHAEDKEKDQSYFLWQLSQEQLRHVLFPLGEYTKSEVRKLAKQLDLPSAKTPDSQEICFVPGAINDFLKKYIKPKPGKVVCALPGSAQACALPGSAQIGKHNGLAFYTIGQRKGIGLSGGPYWVLDKDLKNNRLIITKNEKDLLKKELIAKDVNWLSGKEPNLPLKVSAKIRYRSKIVSAVITKTLNPKRYTLKFYRAQRAITPGQSVVFYGGRELLGGGIIAK